MADALGREVSDRVVLEPFDLIEEAQVTSVLVEASVQDKQGRSVKSLPPSAFTVLEDGVPQQLDLAQQEAVGVTFALLIDSSRSMSRRLEFVQRTAATLADYMSPLDRMIVAPFSKGLLRHDRADGRSRDPRRSHRCDSVERRHRHPRFAGAIVAQLPGGWDAARGRS